MYGNIIYIPPILAIFAGQEVQQASISPPPWPSSLSLPLLLLSLAHMLFLLFPRCLPLSSSSYLSLQWWKRPWPIKSSSEQVPTRTGGRGPEKPEDVVASPVCREMPPSTVV